MGEHMRNNQLVLNQTVSIKKKGITRIRINDELINFTQPKIILQLHFLKLFPKTPMCEPGWHSVSTKCVNDLSWTNIISHLVNKTYESRNILHNITNSLL